MFVHSWFGVWLGIFYLIFGLFSISSFLFDCFVVESVELVVGLSPDEVGGCRYLFGLSTCVLFCFFPACSFLLKRVIPPFLSTALSASPSGLVYFLFMSVNFVCDAQYSPSLAYCPVLMVAHCYSFERL